MRKAGLRLDDPESAVAALPSGNGYAIAPNDLSKSELFHRIISHDPMLQMPPPDSNLELSVEEIAFLTAWIEQGAVYKPHWSLIPPDRSLLREKSADIDFFVANRLKSEGLAFSSEAEKETLIRRVTFDLTGLPPTISEVDDFLADTSPDAYEKVVDRLLASPHFGERMAVNWLDVSRYADTYGYQADFPRPTWRWRDWVIDAYNQNMSYDEFITWQLAGDLMPNPKREQILATGFNRNHAQNAEGGIINEEYRVEYVVDRTNTLGTAFLGLTLECARCHDHKYDPVSQKEYFQLYSFFNNVDEAGQITWSNLDMPSPTLLLPGEEAEMKILELDRKIAAVEKEAGLFYQTQENRFKEWLLSNDTDTGLNGLNSGLAAHYPLDQVSSNEIPGAIVDATAGKYIDPVTEKVVPEQPVQIDGKVGNGLQLDGDTKLDFGGVGRFLRGNAFSVGMWINVPKALKDGVIFHSCRGAIIYSFKGYQVMVSGGKFDVRLSHTFPYNSIHLVSQMDVPRDEWFYLMLTYDGSSKAEGVKLYYNGKETAMRVMRDNLYKEIVFVKEGTRTNLKVGAQWRGKGLSGGLVDEISVYNRALTPLEAAQAAGDRELEALLAKPVNELSKVEYQKLFDYYLARWNVDYRNKLSELEQLRLERNAVEEEVEEVMVMAEMPTPRPAFVLERGAYDAHGERVEPDTPESILDFPDDYPKNRLGLSKWLTDPNHPLTARVMVNRLWQQCFGKGLVETADDFGSQGKMPTHPELLDWLALEFIESGWDTKAMLKRMVISKTYRQTSKTSPELLEKDPKNNLYARGPAKRLSAEMLRDGALAASGLLVEATGGPSVKPYQPEGLWSYSSWSNYNQGKGDDLYRRSLYTFWKRTIPPPSMNTFDAPTRSNCTVRRQETNTPLQALVLLNDPQFLEASKILAVRTMKEGGDSVRDRVSYAFRLLTARKPKDAELEILEKMVQDHIRRFEEEPSKYEALLSEGEKALDEAYKNAETAAYAVVASTIMNSDACVIKR